MSSTWSKGFASGEIYLVIDLADITYISVLGILTKTDNSSMEYITSLLYKKSNIDSNKKKEKKERFWTSCTCDRVCYIQLSCPVGLSGGTVTT